MPGPESHQQHGDESRPHSTDGLPELDPQQIQKLSQALKTIERRLTSAVKEKQWTVVGAELFRLEEIARALPEVVAELVDRPIEEATLSMIHCICRDCPDASLVSAVHRAGGDIEQPTSLDDRKLGSEQLSPYSPLHIAARNGRLEHVRELLRLGHPADVELDNGSTPLSVHLLSDQFSPEIVSTLREAGTRFHKSDLKRILALDEELSIQPHDHSYLESYFSDLGAIQAEDYDRTFPVRKRQREQFARHESPVRLPELLGCIKEDARKLTPHSYHDIDPFNELATLTANSGNVYTAYLYARAFLNATDTQLIRQNPRESNPEMAYLLYDLLNSSWPTDTRALARKIEEVYDRHERLWGNHPNEAELMTLLNHPEVPLGTQTNDSSAHLTACLTGFTRFAFSTDTGEPVPLNWDTVDAWGRAGTLSHSFLRWKHDAAPVRDLDGDIRHPALLELWGASRIPERPQDFNGQPGEPGRKPFLGTGYLVAQGSKSFKYLWSTPETGTRVKQYDSSYHVEFRQAYILVSSEEGTALIRNSSPHFGRDRFPHPLYWSDRGIGSGFAVQELLNLSTRMVKDQFTPFLDKSINTHLHQQSQSLGRAMEQVCALAQDFGCWKFDTREQTAWAVEDEFAGNDLLIGGFLSDGYDYVVEWLKSKFEVAQEAARRGLEDHPRFEVPELAFIHRDYTPLNPYPFLAPDADDVLRERRTLRVDEEVIATLEQLRERRASEGTLYSTGMREFFQAGFDQQAELILLSPSRR